jgi:hypothetical protein
MARLLLTTRAMPKLALALFAVVAVLAVAGCNDGALSIGGGDGGADLAGPPPDLAQIDLALIDLALPPPPPNCGAAPAPFAGALCGPAGAPCTVRRNEPIVTPAAFRNDAPAIALDHAGHPHVFFSSAEGNYKGFLAIRGDAGAWAIEDTPIGAATGAIALGPGDVVHAFFDDGATRLA